MELKDIMTISGQPGLFKMVSQGKNAIIVENLTTGKRMPTYASHRMSGLADIALFTEGEDLPLKEVFRRLFEKMDGKESENPKDLSNDELKAFFAEIVPEYDRERVYVSDMRKALLWYNELAGLSLLDFSEEENEDKAADQTEKLDQNEPSQAPKETDPTESAN